MHKSRKNLNFFLKIWIIFEFCAFVHMGNLFDPIPIFFGRRKCTNHFMLKWDTLANSMGAGCYYRQRRRRRWWWITPLDSHLIMMSVGILIWAEEKVIMNCEIKTGPWLFMCIILFYHIIMFSWHSIALATIFFIIYKQKSCEKIQNNVRRQPPS